MTSKEYRQRKMEIDRKIDEAMERAQKIAEKTRNTAQVVHDTESILNDLDNQFCQKTGLTRMDMGFLFTAIGLQVARQYLLTKFPQRVDDQTAANNTLGHIEEHSNRHHRYYNPSLEEVTSNPVPFDANIGANGALAGGGQMGHRVTAIGHDPVLGLIFGTANIATSTLTTSDFRSYHIYTNANGLDYFRCNANTGLVLAYTIDKMTNESIEDKKIIAMSLIKEIIHLKSDLNTKRSLPLPFVSVVNPQYASVLAEYGLDMANVMAVGKQASYAELINFLIAVIHMLFCNTTGEMERNLYEVRTRKILDYSNLVATYSNIAVSAATQDANNFDLGGMAVTIYRLITDTEFIRKVKEEFVIGRYKDMIIGE